MTLHHTSPLPFDRYFIREGRRRLVSVAGSTRPSYPCAQKCRHIFSHCLKVEDYRVILLSGTGIAAHEGDAEKVRA